MALFCAQGLFSGKGVDGEIQCQVKLMTISRGDSQIAAQVVKEAKRWITHGEIPLHMDDCNHNYVVYRHGISKRASKQASKSNDSKDQPL